MFYRFTKENDKKVYTVLKFVNDGLCDTIFESMSDEIINKIGFYIANCVDGYEYDVIFENKVCNLRVGIYGDGFSMSDNSFFNLRDELIQIIEQYYFIKMELLI